MSTPDTRENAPLGQGYVRYTFDADGDAQTEFISGEQAEIAALHAQLDDRNAWCEHLAARESALLLAVPRPFRTFVHRRAERIQRKLEAQ